MNKKQFLLVLGVLVALLAAGGGLLWSERSDWKTSDTKAGQRLIPDLKASDVAELVISAAGERLTLKKGEAGWGIVERNGFPANVERIGELLLKLVEMKVVQTDAAADSQRARLGLQEPGADVGKAEGDNKAEGAAKDEANAAGTVLELKDAAGKSLARLLLGKKLSKSVEGPAGARQEAAGRYLLSGNAETGKVLNVIVVADPLAQVEVAAEQWVAKELIRVERAKSIVATGPDGRQRFALSRENDDAEWKLAGGEKGDSGKIIDVTSGMISMNLTDVVAGDKGNPGAENGLDKPVVIRADTLDGISYVLRLGAKSGEDKVYARVSVSGEIAQNIPRTPPKDEKAEDKDKNDQSWIEHRKREAARVAREKKLEGWTLLLSRNAVEALLRERSQFLPEKKKDDKKGGR
jgi:hypothetical protein